MGRTVEGFGVRGTGDRGRPKALLRKEIQILVSELRVRDSIQIFTTYRFLVSVGYTIRYPYLQFFVHPIADHCPLPAFVEEINILYDY